ncbi:MAG: TrmB family transcriptional regulator [Nanoarchaeota archaeon]|nr:TrmB family transcriptional regulator [Nanoarchaeota archaeon]
MLSNPEIINALSQLGLTNYESKVYLSLVSEGICTAKDISNICGIPYGKVYEVINSLAAKGFINVLPTKPMKYKAIHPKELIKVVKEREEDKLKNIQKKLLPILEISFSKNNKSEFEKGAMWMVIGRGAINKKLSDMFQSAEKRIIICTTKNGIKRLLFYNNILKDLSEKGVDIFISTKVTKSNLEHLKNFDFCNISHVNQDVPNHFVSVDGKEAILYEAIPDDENFNYGRDIGAWIVNPSFVKFLEGLFMINHSHSKKFKERLYELGVRKR